jgi:type 2 lantibiotic biosynthesis protein LanM
MARHDAEASLLDLPNSELSPHEAWMLTLSEAFESYANDATGDGPIALRDPFGMLLAPVLPLIFRGRHHLQIHLQQLASKDSGLNPSAWAPLLLGDLLTQLSQMTVRTVVLEMDAARQRGELLCITPEERFAEFVARLQSPDGGFEFLATYPALARQAVVATEQWLATSVEFAARLVHDAPRLENRFFAGQPLPRLTNIEAGAGDRHRGGRSVAILTWENGQKLVYKPRSLAVESHFQGLVDWVNQRSAGLQLRTLALLDRQDYGWVEYVSHTDVCDRSAMRRFYQRQGAYLALVYLLSATDLHAENLLAAGEHPILIDLEALFHHRLPGPRKDAAALGLTNSVLAVRMLPQATYIAGFDDPIDFSGLGATAGQATPFRASQWQNVGRDDMRLDTVPVETPAGAHRPRLAGEEIDYRDYKSDLVAGFVETYRMLEHHRDELLSPDGPVAAFSQDAVRFIARPTQVYAILLEQSFHPHSLISPDQRQHVFQRLERQASDFACLERLIPHETDDLNHNDIPIFTTTPAGRALITSAGRTLADFFPESALELVYQRIANLGEADLARQIWLIDAAFTIAGRRSEPRPVRSFSLASAEAIGDRLLELMHRQGTEVGWIGLHSRGRGWSIGAVGSDLLHGQAGIALFLGYLAEFTGAIRFRQAAQCTAHSILDRLNTDLEHAELVAQLDGAGQVPQVFMLLSRLWDLPDLAVQAERWAEARQLTLSSKIQDGSFHAADRLVRRALAGNPTPVRECLGIDQPHLVGGLAGLGWQMLAALADHQQAN